MQINERIELHSLAETEQFGAQLAQSLQPNAVVALLGDLGSGKTALTRGVARGLGIAVRDVVSPTFTMLIEHEAGSRGLPLFHFDLYRLTDPTDWTGLGFDEYLAAGGVSILEWPAVVASLLPEQTLWLRLTAPDLDQPELRLIERLAEPPQAEI